MSSIPTVKGTTPVVRAIPARSARTEDRLAERYAVLTPIQKLNADAIAAAGARYKFRPDNWTHMELHGYRLRVTQLDLQQFACAFAGTATEEDWRDFLIENAECRWNGDWIPMDEALRLDDEASDQQEDAA